MLSRPSAGPERKHKIKYASSNTTHDVRCYRRQATSTHRFISWLKSFSGISVSTQNFIKNFAIKVHELPFPSETIFINEIVFSHRRFHGKAYQDCMAAGNLRKILTFSNSRDYISVHCGVTSKASPSATPWRHWFKNPPNSNLHSRRLFPDFSPKFLLVLLWIKIESYHASTVCNLIKNFISWVMSRHRVEMKMSAQHFKISVSPVSGPEIIRTRF